MSLVLNRLFSGSCLPFQSSLDILKTIFQGGSAYEKTLKVPFVYPKIALTNTLEFVLESFKVSDVIGDYRIFDRLYHQ